jgi:putative tricarboxylic transport membrane protein
MNMKRDVMIEGCVLFLCGAVTAVLSLEMPIGAFRMAGSGLFPLCLGIALMLLALLYLATLLFQEDEKRQSPKTAVASPGAMGRMLLFLGASALATLCLNILGYPVTSFLFMMALLAILGVRQPVLLVSLPLLTAAGSYLVFIQFLRIPLPKGLIGL